MWAFIDKCVTKAFFVRAGDGLNGNWAGFKAIHIADVINFIRQEWVFFVIVIEHTKIQGFHGASKVIGEYDVLFGTEFPLNRVIVCVDLIGRVLTGS